MSPLDDLVDVSLASPPNISPRSHPPAPSARSTASFIDIPTDEDDASTSLSSFDILRWQRRIPCDFGSPVVPPLSGVQLDALPRIPAFSAPLRADNSALPSPQYVPCDEPPAYQGTVETPVSALANPPPLRRSMVPLPPVPYEEQAGMQSDELLSPLMTNLRDVFRIESLVARAEKCADASRDAALSLCSCSLLKNPKVIMEVCNSIPPLLATIQVELNKTPKAFGLKNSGDLQRWFHRHCEILASVERNIDLFYLFANKIRQNPPRIHKLEGYVNKFYAYHVKFSDLARRLAISNEKLHLIDLRARLIAENRAARLHADQERMHRHDFRVTWQEDRERRRAMREEFLLARDTARQLKLAKMSSNDIVPAAPTEARRQGR
ncbi:hypothetical protein WOLCODRAFT_167006 [Wolfiporia cocos MD-104 SS10]|uniref:Uncharacterized protein n=1 Tax=Wolfiporia cocos (strain MD-104) TaxID=742152 RepID=A0A2H3JKQ6_WOLCO|nr:hypothetical protein WOLCODRAFT_167006 [Wolfiporia cocos MD-104 SS10]